MGKNSKKKRDAKKKSAKKSVMDHDAFVAKARATAVTDGLQAQLLQLGEMRRELRDGGWGLPLDIREQVDRTRQLLVDNGIPEDAVNATPGLEPLTREELTNPSTEDESN